MRIASTLREVDATAFAPKRRSRAASVEPVQLTRRQLEILQHVARGLTNAEIALLLFLSPRTVEMHVSDVLAALDSRSRADAVRRAAELNLLDSSQ
jgi:DNA-binding NarL/FixJ family response regulator